MIHIPGITDEIRIRIAGRGIEDLGDINKTDLLTYTKAFAHLDKNRAENFITSEAKWKKGQTQPGEFEKRYSQKEINREGSWGRKSFDKSGYKLDPVILLDKLKKYNRDNYARVLKSYYERLDSVRKDIQKQMMSISIKNERPDERMVLDVHTNLFRAINSYRTFKDNLESILETSNKIERDYKLNRLFGVITSEEDMDKLRDIMKKEGREFSTFYPDVSAPDLREKIIELETTFKKVNLTTLEQLEEK
jgi:hypothetical protein